MSHEQFRWSIWRTVLPLLLLTAALAYYAGGEQFQGRIDDLQEQHTQQQLELENLSRHNEVLLSGKAEAQHQLQAKGYMLDRLKEILQVRDRELKSVNKELEFFRKVMDSDKEPELSVDSLRLVPSGESKGWEYELVIFKHNHFVPIKGHYDFVFHGREGTQVAEHRLSDLLKGGKPLPFKFHYFLEVKGRFRLPLNFEAERVTVEVLPKGKSLRSIHKVYSWTQLLSSEEGA